MELLMQPRMKNGLPLTTDNEDVILIHDDRFKTNFSSGRIETLNPSGRNWVGKITIKITSLPATILLSTEKEIIANNQDYYSKPDFYSRPVFCHTEYHLDKSSTDTLLNGDLTNFVHYTNVILNQFIYPSFFYRLFIQIENGRVNTTEDDIELTYWIYSSQGSTPSKEELISRIKTDLRWLPVRLGMGVTAPELPTKLYSNGSDRFVNHPILGQIPGGLDYLDLMNWDGQNRDFLPSDIKYTG
jgi:hypothetical protein